MITKRMVAATQCHDHGDGGNGDDGNDDDEIEDDDVQEKR